MSFATQSHDPVVIDKVAQPSNSNVQDAATNIRLSAADQEDEFESFDDEFEDTLENESENEIVDTNQEAE